MSNKSLVRLAGLGGAAMLTLAIPNFASATEGYFALGFGPVQRGTGGAGVAAVTDAMGAALNPASVATLGQELDYGAEIFAPNRGYNGNGTAIVASGDVRSDAPAFVIPHVSWNRPLANGNVLNISAYGNGGMNTTYNDVVNGHCPPPPDSAGFGVFCGGDAGVDLMQLFVQATYAGKSGSLSWGIAPTLAVQRFAAKGLAAFGDFSVDRTKLTDNGYDYSTGVGLRAGVQMEVSPTVTLGLSGQTKFNMSKFSKYAGLYEDGGKFDIPASVTAGVAVKLSPAVTFMADYQHIYYSGVPAVSNATDAGAFGAPGGAGFGWDDVDVYKVGVAWAASPDMTWRAGYAHSSNPVGTDDVTLNILAPGIVTDHFTVGGSRKIGANRMLDFSLMYVPENTVTGDEVVPTSVGIVSTADSITLDMHQFAASVGLRMTF